MCKSNQACGCSLLLSTCVACCLEQQQGSSVCARQQPACVCSLWHAVGIHNASRAVSMPACCLQVQQVWSSVCSMVLVCSRSSVYVWCSAQLSIIAAGCSGSQCRARQHVAPPPFCDPVDRPKLVALGLRPSNLIRWRLMFCSQLDHLLIVRLCPAGCHVRAKTVKNIAPYPEVKTRKRVIGTGTLREYFHPQKNDQ